jgi:hypothetical protein
MIAVSPPSSSVKVTACSWDPGLDMDILILCHSAKTDAVEVLKKTRAANRIG